ncbi:hypothetical protein LLG90_23905 [Aromatoleum toluclasticum]|uniref:hypothetical protein n=1 Tax=Aromatoleum toluclasticum TaxID=92003 RepID=UPI001D194EF3|nr:hypothetical protein [Aromatoleum toluclasticum]MCC4118405.1 hypothetical protein [Aromatoleum toluclasticum]
MIDLPTVRFGRVVGGVADVKLEQCGRLTGGQSVAAGSTPAKVRLAQIGLIERVGLGFVAPVPDL